MRLKVNKNGHFEAMDYESALYLQTCLKSLKKKKEVPEDQTHIGPKEFRMEPQPYPAPGSIIELGH